VIAPAALLVVLAVHALQAWVLAVLMTALLERLDRGSGAWRARIAGLAFWGGALLPLAARLNDTLLVSVGSETAPRLAVEALFRLPDAAPPWVDATAAVLLIVLGVGAGWRLAATARAVRAGERLAAAGFPVDPVGHGLPGGVRLVASDAVDGPLVAGLLRPVIVAPARVLALPLAERSALLRHELAHLRRRDLRRALAQRIAADLFWFNPGLQRLGRLLAEQRELASDEAAAEHDRPGYGLALLGEARSRLRPPQAHAVGAAHGSLHRRLQRLSEGLRRAPVGALAGALLAMAVLVVLTPRIADTGETHVGIAASR